MQLHLFRWLTPVKPGDFASSENREYSHGGYLFCALLLLLLPLLLMLLLQKMVLMVVVDYCFDAVSIAEFARNNS